MGNQVITVKIPSFQTYFYTFFQAEVLRLMSKLRINVGSKPRKIRNVQGYRGQMDALRLNVSALITNERLEMAENRGILTRQYTEKLIADAILYGDKHTETMERAKWWLANDDTAIYKLFDVLVPRYENFTSSFTRMLYAPRRIRSYEEYSVPIQLQKSRNEIVLVELKGHPFPPLYYSNTKPNRKHIHNVLLSEAKRDLQNKGLE